MIQTLIRMDYLRFSAEVSKIKNLELPGPRSHHEMAPIERVEALKQLDRSPRGALKAGVMALFYPGQQGDTRFLLILRNRYPGIHSNQVGFPGGKMEGADPDLLHTALRETEEEVGVAATHIEVVRELSQLYIPPSNFQVQPYLGYLPQAMPFKPDPKEVQQLIEVPLERFMDNRVIKHRAMKTSYAEMIDVPVYELEGYSVWGATAMMLSEIRMLLSQIL